MTPPTIRSRSSTERELLEERNALERWTAEGGSARDPFDALARIEARLQRQEERRRTWPYERVRRGFVAFEDLTRPEERTFGFYLISLAGAKFGQVICASHPTAKRLARSRTQYGEVQLSFLEPVTTPALD
ncbi:MAG: hypothetical protein GEU75_14880 [Dehalococcoidia bacterium]|nr:hypothetical protein [Dehalococcoidia bacterium]